MGTDGNTRLEIKLPHHLYLRIKVFAASRGRTMGDVISGLAEQLPPLPEENTGENQYDSSSKL